MSFLAVRGDDEISGLAGNDTLTGGAGDDILLGGAGRDFLYGGDGDDTLDAGANDTGSWQYQYLYGQGGDDTYLYSQDAGFVFIGYETATTGEADQLILTDLNVADLVLSYYDYGSASPHGNTLVLDWFGEGSTRGRVFATNEGEHIERYEFADGTTLSGIGLNASGALELTGTSGDDTIIGSDGADIISGFGGDDEISGLAGDDTLTGGAGDDILLGGAGADILNGGAGNDTLDAGSAGVGWQSVYGQDGNDTYLYSKDSGLVYVATESSTSGDADRVVFSDLNVSDLTVGYAVNNELRLSWTEAGSYGELQITDAGQYIETYQFADGTTLSGIGLTASGDLELVGTSGDDTIIGSDGIDVISGGAGDDEISGLAGNDTLTGGAGDDILLGGAGRDFLYGGDGDDTLDAGANDTGSWQYQYLYGQGGDDTYLYSQDAGFVFIGYETATTGEADQLILTDLNVADLVLSYYDYGSASPHGNTLVLDWFGEGSTRGRVFATNEGEHIERYEFADGTTLSGIGLNASGALELTGTSGDDTIIGSDGADIISGFGGDDEISGLAGDDTLTGGAGDDILLGGAGADILNGGAGNDTLDAGSAGVGWQSVYGQDGNDTYLYSKDSGLVYVATESSTSGDADRVVFSDLNVSDLTVGYAVNNELRLSWTEAGSYGELQITDAGQYIETYQFADGTTLSGIGLTASGDLELVGTSGDDTIIGSDGIDVISGGAGDDEISGLAGNDTLTGGAGDDILLGGAGADILNGGAGNDTLDAGSAGVGWQSVYGQDGNDTYLYSKDSGLVYVATESSTSGDADRVVFSDLNVSDLTVGYAVNNELRLSWTEAGSYGELQITDAGQYIETYQFADGTTLSGIGLTASGDLELVGTSGDDTIIGSDGIDVISGGAGDDEISGLAGNDTLTGGAGDDILLGGAGRDFLYGGDGDDTLDAGANDTGSWQYQYLYGQGGDDTYLYSQDAGFVFIGYETATTGEADQLILTDLNVADLVLSYYDYGSASPHGNTLVLDWFGEGSTRGRVFATNEGEHIERYEFADGTTLSGIGLNASGALELTGTSGDDTIIGSDGADIISGFGGDDEISGLAGDDTLTGGAGDDILLGGAGADILNGGAGNDTLDAGSAGVGWQSVYGQDGNDTYLYSKDSGLVYVATESSTSGDADRVVFSDLNVSDLTVGYAVNNELRLSWTEAGSYGELQITDAGQYIETYQFADGTTLSGIGLTASGDLELVGTSGDDTIIGSDGIDVISGGAGDDEISGLAGNDTLTGGAGDDILLGGAGADILNGGAGNDTLDAGSAGVGWQSVYGQDGNDTYLYSKDSGLVYVATESSTSGDADRVVFSDLNVSDLTVGYAVNNELRLSWTEAGSYGELQITDAGQYIETYQFADGTTLSGIGLTASGDLELVGTSGDDTIIGSDGIDVISGGAGDDEISGLAGNDTLTGGAGDDILLGGAGADILNGGAGDDTLDAGSAGVGWQSVYGQDGNDTYLYSQESQQVFLAGETSATGDNDRVVLNDLNVSDLSVGYYDYSNDVYGNALRLNWSSATSYGELQITHEGQFIETFQFADGTTLSEIGLNAAGDLELVGTSGDDTIIGSNSGAEISGGLGDDTITGGLANDTYFIGQGDGLDTIHNNDSGASLDVLRFNDVVDTNNIWLGQVGSDLRVSVLGATDGAILANWFGDTSSQVDEVQLGDGDSLLRSDINQLVNAMAAYTNTDGSATASVQTGTVPNDVQLAIANAWT